MIQSLEVTLPHSPSPSTQNKTSQGMGGEGAQERRVSMSPPLAQACGSRMLMGGKNLEFLRDGLHISPCELKMGSQGPGANCDQ